MFYKGVNCFRKGFLHRRVLDVFQRGFAGFLELFFKEYGPTAASVFTSHSKVFLTHFMPLISFDTPWKHFFGVSEVFRVYQKRSVAWNGLITVIKSFGAFSERSYLFLFYSSTLIKTALNHIFSLFFFLWIKSTAGVKTQLN